jgi:hypothetical protein
MAINIMAAKGHHWYLIPIPPGHSLSVTVFYIHIKTSLNHKERSKPAKKIV